MTTLSGLGDIQWVKCYRQRTGASLREAMAALEKSKTGPRGRPVRRTEGASSRTQEKVGHGGRKPVGSPDGRTGGAGSRKRKSKTPQGASSSNPRPASASPKNSSRVTGRGARSADGQDTRPSVAGLVAPRPRHQHETFTQPCSNCARCGGEHDAIVYRKFSRPPELSAPQAPLPYATHRGECPAVGEPILFITVCDACKQPAHGATDCPVPT